MGVDNILCDHYLVYSCKILSRGCRGGMGMVVVTTMGSDNGIKDKILGMRLNDSHSGEWELPTLSKLKDFIQASFHL